MRILYLSVSYLPSRRASSVQVMRMCDAFAAAGHDVTLVAKRSPELAEDVRAFYGATSPFAISLVPRPRRPGGEIWFASAVARQVLRRRASIDLVYSRDLVGGAFAAELGLPTVYEAHGVFELGWQRALWRRMLRGRRFLGLVAISRAMVGELAAIDLLPQDRPVVVAHSPANAYDAVAAREVSSPPRIGYVGSLYPGRGIDLVLDIARRMPACTFELVGGSQADLDRWRAASVPTNVVFRGFVTPAELPATYRTYDVLLMPYPHAGVHGPTQRLDTARYCSPMKMFEYMASGVPMVASDLPVLQEVLVDGENALIAPYGDVARWCDAIDRLLRDRPLRESISACATRDLTNFTPEARTRKILTELSLV